MQRLVSPLAGLVAFVVIYTIASGISYQSGQIPSDRAQFVANFGWSFCLTWWVYRDRRCREQSVPFEFEAFVFFAWPLVLPCYLFKTRGWRALPWVFGLTALWLVPDFWDLVVLGISPF